MNTTLARLAGDLPLNKSGSLANDSVCRLLRSGQARESGSLPGPLKPMCLRNPQSLSDPIRGKGLATPLLIHFSLDTDLIFLATRPHIRCPSEDNRPVVLERIK